MLFKNVLNRGDLAMLRTVFDAHCKEFGIASKEGRDSVAASLMVHYQNGVANPDELLAALDKEERIPNGPTAPVIPING